jgi:sigma-B regulation protein RsbU (phosphoserine phosphatase)
MALGIAQETDYLENGVALEVGDVLVLYTDGISEAANENNEEFGVPRLCEVVRKAIEGSAQDVVNALDQALNNFIGSGAPFDDITLVVLKRIAN